METSNAVPIQELPDQRMPLGFSDQACKECRRRKSKCNRAIPTCNLCVKYRRHCLYEKHSRTPLTRKHLTEVEERLEQAEALIRQMRAALPPHLRGAAASQGRTAGNDSPALGGQGPSPSILRPPLGVLGDSPPQDSHSSLEDVDGSVYAGQPSAMVHEVHGEERGSDNVLESPPSTEDFEWDEQEAGTQSSPDIADVSDINDSRQVLDGMASLTVCEKHSGYLGIASGAALLRIFEPAQRKHSQPHSHLGSVPRVALVEQPNPNKHIADCMIDSYFRVYHLNYPIIHEPTFRAQYSEVIRRPNGDSWFVLAYVVAALGVFTTSTTLNTLDLDLFSHAKSLLSFDLLEVGNLTMVQALALTSNYQQKRDKPNSAYSYYGLATRMAMGLGLHKEFQGWRISPLSMEIRRRVWWALCVFDVGATITFSRPQVWPFDAVDISMPMNINDKDLTVMSKSYPLESNEATTYTAVRTQASFHVATNPIYVRIISKPSPTAEELLRLEKTCLEKWVESIPAYFSEASSVPVKFAFAHAVMQWRYRNFRIIMYRPFFIRRALLARGGCHDDSTPETLQACERCLTDAKLTISSISEFWATHEHIRVIAWYALYFLFQAALIPCVCLQSTPSSPQASDWRDQIDMALRVIVALAPVNPSAARCHQVIVSLCGPYLNHDTVPLIMNSEQRDAPTGHSNVTEGVETSTDPTLEDGDQEIISVDDGSQSQINAVFTMMWPNVPLFEAADLVIGDDTGMGFLQ